MAAIADNDSLVALYTGFPSYGVFLAFYEFLGPAVHKLRYWTTTSSKTQRKRKTKLDAINQLFMTLVKLKLDLTFQELSFCFKISQATVS